MYLLPEKTIPKVSLFLLKVTIISFNKLHNTQILARARELYIATYMHTSTMSIFNVKSVAIIFLCMIIITCVREPRTCGNSILLWAKLAQLNSYCISKLLHHNLLQKFGIAFSFQIYQVYFFAVTVHYLLA